MVFEFGGLAEEIIAGLTLGARQALPYIVHAVHGGLSANAIGRMLEEAGLGVRRASLLSAVRAVRESLIGAEVERGLKEGELPDPSLFRGAVTFMQRNYAYIVQVKGRNSLTGGREKRNITISTNTVLSPDQLEEYIGDVMEASSDVYNLELSGYDITAVLVDPRVLP